LKRAHVIGTGSYLPEKVLTNFDLEKMVDTSDEWIVERSGIHERRIANEDETTSTLAINAAQKAIEDAKITPEDVDCLIVATNSPDNIFPATAGYVQRALKLPDAMGFDIQAGCTGFVYALQIATSFIEAERYKTVLVIASEALTRITDWQDRTTCVLFGDGSGAMVLRAGDDDSRGVLNSYARITGDKAESLIVPSGGSRMPTTEETARNRMQYVKMNGKDIFKFSIGAIGDATKKVLNKAGISIEDVNWFIPHQANIRIINFAAKTFKIPNDKIVVTLDKYGNTSSASIPIAIDELRRSGKAKEGDLLLLVAFGAGLTYGASLVKL